MTIAWLGGCVLVLSALAAASAQDAALTDRLLALDRRILGHNRPADDAARVRVAELGTRARRECPLDHGRIDPACVLSLVLGTGGLEARRDDRAVEANAVSRALAGRAGSCASLTAIALAIAEELSPGAIGAVILTDHTLLTERGGAARTFEPLEGGRVLRPNEIERYAPFPPGGPAHVDAEGFIPYYLDNLAARLAAAGRHDAAERAFTEALTRGPRVARVHYNYGTWLLQQERWTEAAQHLDRAIDLGWRDADALVNRGVARWRLGKKKAAERDFREALELKPGDRRARMNLARLEAER